MNIIYITISENKKTHTMVKNIAPNIRADCRKKKIPNTKTFFQLFRSSSPLQRITSCFSPQKKREIKHSSAYHPALTYNTCREKNRYPYRESQNKVVPSHCCPLRPSERTSKEAARHIGKFKHSLLFRV